MEQTIDNHSNMDEWKKPEHILNGRKQTQNNSYCNVLYRMFQNRQNQSMVEKNQKKYLLWERSGI